jgi:CRISPR-associated protein Csb3
MNKLSISGDFTSALTHFAAYGAAAILEQQLGITCRIGLDTLQALAVSSDSGCAPNDLATAIRQHAADRVDSWPTRTHDHLGSATGTLSPRIKAAQDREAWQELQRNRHAAIDETYSPSPAWLDLAFISALGEPAYWFTNMQGKNLPDSGASSWEMKTRNRGEEFIGNRLAGLCRAVAARSPEEVLAGLNGESPRDEVGGNSSSSRTPTGLSLPAPTDNALAWCALWGIALFPMLHNAGASASSSPRATGRHSQTTGVLRSLPRPMKNIRAYTYLPLINRPVRLARLRTILVSGALARHAAYVTLAATEDRWSRKERARLEKLKLSLDRPADMAWLQRKGCSGILTAHINQSDNINAPELHVVSGTPHVFAGGSP